MFSSAATDVAALIVAVAGLITAIGGLYAIILTLHVAKRTNTVAVETHTEVKTMNGLSMAQMADAGETRRVDAIPVEDRTEGEQEHIEAEPMPNDQP